MKVIANYGLHVHNFGLARFGMRSSKQLPFLDLDRYNSFKESLLPLNQLYYIIFENKINAMTERELIKLEGTIRKKMDDIKNQRVSLKDSGIGGLLNSLKKVDEALYEKILPEYKKLVAEKNIFK